MLLNAFNAVFLSNGAYKSFEFLFLSSDKKKIQFSLAILGIYLALLFWRFITHCYRSLKKIQTDPEEDDLSSFFGFFFRPITTAIDFSAKLLEKPMSRFITSKSSDYSPFDKENIFPLIGAFIVFVFFYLNAVMLISLLNGISIDKAALLLEGDWNQRASIIIGFFRENIFFNFTVFSLYLGYVYYKINTRIFEPHYNNSMDTGLVAIIPVAKWDSYPKPHVSEAQIGEAYRKSIVELITKETTGIVKLKLASGYDCFGSKEEPGYLSDLLKGNSTRRWEILLLNPNGNGLAERAQGYVDLGGDDRPIKSIEEYKSGVEKVIENLKWIKSEYKCRMIVRVFDHNPVWKIFLISDTAIVQTFGKGHRSEKTPAYFFEKNPTSLYYGFQFTFEQVWDEASNIIC